MVPIKDSRTQPSFVDGTSYEGLCICKQLTEPLRAKFAARDWPATVKRLFLPLSC